MQRGKFLFVLSLLFVLLFAVFWWVILLIKSLESDPVNAVMFVSDTMKARNVNLKDSVKSTPVQLSASFAYLGIVKRDRHGDTKKQHTEKIVSNKNENLSGRNKMREGVIPELTIESGERNIQSIADRLGFVLVASTEDKILGKIIDDTFTPIGKNELAKFSARARSADALDRYDEVRDRIARQFVIPSYEVKLMFLVPLRVEAQWINTQKIILNQISVSSDQVAVMRGYYDLNFNVRIAEVVTKDGQAITIQ